MQIIFGINTIMEVLKSERKKGTIKKIMVAEGKKSEAVKKILRLAELKEIPVCIDTKEKIEKLAGHKSHQGIICISEDYRYAGIDKIIDNCHASFKSSLILILDGIQDPQNLGSIIRTSHCFGINGIIIPENRSVSVTPAVIKVSSGTAQYMQIAQVVNISKTIDYLKEKGFWIYGTEASEGVDLDSHGYNGHIGLVMGSEEKGIRPLVKKKCDFLISIPMVGKIDSFNVSVATGIILYEMNRYRKS